jgi:hypothetical protein
MPDFDRAAIEERLNKYRRAREAFLGRQDGETGKAYEAAHSEWQWRSLEDILSCLAEIDRLELENERLAKACGSVQRSGSDAEGGE